MAFNIINLGSDYEPIISSVFSVMNEHGISLITFSVTVPIISLLTRVFPVAPIIRRSNLYFEIASSISIAGSPYSISLPQLTFVRLKSFKNDLKFLLCIKRAISFSSSQSFFSLNKFVKYISQTLRIIISALNFCAILIVFFNALFDSGEKSTGQSIFLIFYG